MSQTIEINKDQEIAQQLHSPTSTKEIELSNLPENNKIFETSPMEGDGVNASRLSEPQSPFTRSMSRLASQLTLKRDYSIPKNSSKRTILAMVNTLIGSGCLLLPLVMKDSGIIPTIFSLTIIGFISAKTSELSLMHAEEGEKDLPEIIVRLLGDKWYYLYSLTAGLLELLIGLAYYLMACNMFYHIMQFICYHAGTELSSYDEVDFSQFSYSWICIIIFVVFFLLSCMDNIKIIIIIGEYGFVCIIGFIIYIIYNLFVSISDGNLNPDNQPVDITWWTMDLSNVFGVTAILYLVHPNAMKIFAEHANQEKNVFIHRLSIFVAYVIYCFISVIGYLGIINVSLPSNVDEANTVLDYFAAQDLSNLLIALMFFFDLVSVFPILLQTGKVLSIQAVWVQYDIKKHKKISRIFDLIFMFLSLFIAIFNISPSAVLSIAGTFIGFLLIYIVPIYIHMLCIYQQDFFLVKYSAIYIPPRPFTKIQTEFSPMDENHQIQQDACFTQPEQKKEQALEEKQQDQLRNDEMNMSGLSLPNSFTFKCNHDKFIQKWMTKKQRYAGYALCQIIGVGILINQIYQMIIA